MHQLVGLQLIEGLVVENRVGHTLQTAIPITQSRLEWAKTSKTIPCQPWHDQSETEECN